MIKGKNPGCGKTIKAQDEWAGKQGNCPGCGALVQISAQPATADCALPTVVQQTASSEFDDVRSFDLSYFTLQPAGVDDHRVCAFCGERILTKAIKCRFCHEFLDGRTPAAVVVQPAPAANPEPRAVSYHRHTDTF